MSQNGQTHLKIMVFKVCLTILGYYALKDKKWTKEPKNAIIQ